MFNDTEIPIPLFCKSTIENDTPIWIDRHTSCSPVQYVPFPRVDYRSWSSTDTGNGSWSSNSSSFLSANALPWPENSLPTKTTSAKSNYYGNFLLNFDDDNSVPRLGSQHPTPTKLISPIARPKTSPIKIDVCERKVDDRPLRLHVSNIPFSWTKEKLAAEFEVFGTTYDIEVVYNARGSKGFGFVTFLTIADGLKAMDGMNEKIVDGRRLVVNYAKPKQKKHVVQPYYTEEEKTLHTKSVSATPKKFIPSFATPPPPRRQQVIVASQSTSCSTTPLRVHQYCSHLERHYHH
ncbi:unnamed protein product [Didymodactylos carnosus]|uniref:RRM domain-containing protein n=1 Tax=Didymodactylos carnosus TaxID=1234261 RepID=A0A815E6L3_9BILA|nr:unnamed protein product [Didymodactylos carnosus]CAF1302791.1 unnamed protein product [Didymodactylos carnosus]CAF3899743.1 unnamed protein product [Didymodactylos carnosus]CAF4129866.1 unnamed protein product [Didymodactylos carnosus]